MQQYVGPGEYQITIHCNDTNLKIELLGRFLAPLPEMMSTVERRQIVDSVQVRKFYKYVNTQLRCKLGIAHIGLSNDQILIQLAGTEELVELRNEEDVANKLEKLEQRPITHKRRRAKKRKSKMKPTLEG